MRERYTLVMVTLVDSELKINHYSFSKGRFVKSFLKNEQENGTKIVSFEVYKNVKVTNGFQ